MSGLAAGENVCFRLLNGEIRWFCRLRDNTPERNILTELPEMFDVTPNGCLTAKGADTFGGSRYATFRLTNDVYRGHRVYQEQHHDIKDN